MDYSVKDFYIPTITDFDSGNKLTGSRNGMNYKMTPQKEEKEIRVQVWYGEWNLEHSDLIASRLFPMTQESMALIEQWLYEQYDVYMETPQASEYRKKQKKREV